MYSNLVKEKKMTFQEWIFSSYPNPSKDGQWGAIAYFSFAILYSNYYSNNIIVTEKKVKKQDA